MNDWIPDNKWLDYDDYIDLNSTEGKVGMAIITFLVIVGWGSGILWIIFG